jgi:MYXO-CTERM domain-containing protein
MRGRVRSVTFAGTLIAASLVARGANAYVRAVSDAGYPLSWSSSCETVTIYLNGFTAMTPDEVAKSIAGAAAAWGPDEVTCPATTGDGSSGHPYFQILPALSSGGAVPEFGKNDGKNSIIFQTTSWDEDPAAVAVTSVLKEPSGNIVDADIEINATDPGNIPWANLDPGSPPARNGILRFDLQTAMTHEFGHFLGLAHTCIGSGNDGNDQALSATDDQGQPVPECATAGAPQDEAVMWYVVDAESITKRILTTDDARGVCAIYPPTVNPPICTQNTPDDGCGCAAAGPRAGGWSGGALPLLALAAAHRRRRRHPQR